MGWRGWGEVVKAMKVLTKDGRCWRVLVMLVWLVLVMILPGTLQAQAVMTTFTGATAPGNWELVQYNPTGTYWFDGTDAASTLTIAGPVNTLGESLTMVQMRPGTTLGRSGYLIFDYDVQQNQATAAELSVYRLLGNGGSSLLASLTGSGRYLSDPVFGPSDRIAFVLSSTLDGKPTPAYAYITPIPEPGDWAVLMSGALVFYGVYRHAKRRAKPDVVQA